MKNLLVSGGAGFIGSNFIRYLAERQPDVFIVNLDALTYAGSLKNLEGISLPDRHTFVHGNILDRDLVRDLLMRFHIDTIVHFAAETHVDRSFSSAEVFFQTNVIGTLRLLESAREYWSQELTMDEKKCFRFHHVSTDEVFGSLAFDGPAFDENSPYQPSSPYAASKAASDHLVRSFYRTYGLPVSISNSSNNYGPFQYPEKFIPQVIINAASGLPIPVYGKGINIRDWLYVDDHCEAICRILEQDTAGVTFLVGGENQLTNLELAESICSKMDEINYQSSRVPHASLIRFISDRPGHDLRYALNTRNTRELLDWRPKYSLDEGLLVTIRWYLDHMPWVEDIQSRGEYRRWIEKNYRKRSTQLPPS
jgi:dTDP-glucose 4,6-dehydratase